MPVNDGDRPYMEEMRKLTRDDEGREILVGLTYAETEWYLAYIKAKWTPSETRKRMASSQEQDERYLEMHDKHELVRQQILMAEIEARDYPIKN